MLVSMSAKINTYEWYTYYGRKLSFNNHHKSYELDLEPRDKFGIKKVGSKYKLIDATDTSTLFTLSEREVKLLIKKSKGFGGKVDKVKVTKGIGGLDPVSRKSKIKPQKKASKSETRIKTDENVVPEIYPKIPMPVKRQDIQRLFHLLNAKYFNNELKTKTKIKIVNAGPKAPLATAYTKYTKNEIIDQTIRLAKSALTIGTRIVDIVLHEMIHLHHKIKFIEHGMTQYDEAHIRSGHGPMFVQDVRKLNALGFNVAEYTADTPQEYMDIDMYVLALYGKDTYTGVYSEKPFKDKVESLVSEISAKWGAGLFTHYKYSKTRNPRVTRMSKLTNKNSLDKGRRLVKLGLNAFTQHIIDDMKVKPHLLIPDQGTQGVSPNIVNVVSMGEKVRTSPYKNFVITMMANSGIPEYEKVTNVSMYTSSKYAQILETLTEPDARYLHNYWKSIPDEVFLKHKDLSKSVYRPLAEGAHGPLRDQRGLSMSRRIIQVAFDYYFKDRRTQDEFKKILGMGMARQKVANASTIHDFIVELFTGYDL